MPTQATVHLPGCPTTASATLSTVVSIPATATADGVDTSTVTVTLLSSGSLPVPNKTVTLSQGAGHSIITPAATPNVSDVNGQVTFTVTDTKAETVTYSADDTTDNVPLMPTDMTTESVTFDAPVVNSLHSTVTASPSTALATGGPTTTITVTLRDQGASPQPVAGKTVTLSGTGSVVIVPAASPNVTNASGVVTFTASDAVAETRDLHRHRHHRLRDSLGQTHRDLRDTHGFAGHVDCDGPLTGGRRVDWHVGGGDLC